MSKKNQEETRTDVEKINDTLTGIGQKVQDNSRVVTWVVCGLVAVVCIVLFWYYGIHKPSIEEADNAIGQADIAMVLAQADPTASQDSVALEMYKAVADNYGHAAGNRASLQTAILLYQKGEYQQALEYAKQFDGSESVIAAGAKSLEGDCYVNLKNYDEALKCYEAAVKKSNDNPQYTPYFLLKEATVYSEGLKDYKKAAEIYQKVVDEYPEYQGGVDVEKYLERARLQAEGK